MLGQGWQYFSQKHKIKSCDIIVVKLDNLGPKVQIYDVKNSRICRLRCHKRVYHSNLAQEISNSMKSI